MNQRRYYIVREIGTGEVDVEAEIDDPFRPDLPGGVEFSARRCGQDCYVVVSYTDLDAAVLDSDLSPSDLVGLDTEELHSLLPLRIPEGVTQERMDEYADAAGMARLSLESVLKMRPGSG